jgi:hypothetical protein
MNDKEQSNETICGTSSKNNKKNNKKNKKNKKNKRDKKIPILRTEEERKCEVRIIIDKLTELQLTIAYDPIRQLFIILKDYVKNGGRIQINIPFPMINKRIKGILADTINEPCCVKLEEEK